MLRRAAMLAESLGAIPLVWPARAVLGALVATSSPAESAAALTSARSIVRQIADDLPVGARRRLARAPGHRRPARRLSMRRRWASVRAAYAVRRASGSLRA